MRFIDYIRTAFKNFVRRKMRSFLTIFAVVIGAVSITVMLSLVIGAKRVFITQLESIGALSLVTVSGNPDIEGGGNLFNGNTGSKDSDSKKLDDTVVNTLRKLDHVTDATAISGVWANSMKLEGQDKKMWPNVIAYEPGSEVFNTPLIAGRTLERGDMDKIVVGGRVLRYYGFADKPEAMLGKKIIFIMAGNNYNEWTVDPPRPPENDQEDYWKTLEKQTLEIPAEIVGIMESGPGDDNNFITLAWARKLMTSKNWQFDKEKQQRLDEQRQKAEQQGIRFEYPSNSEMLILERRDNIAENGYASIMLKVDTTDNVKSVADTISRMGYGVATAQEMLEGISKLFLILGIVLGAVGGIALFVAAIGIINTMVMATYERTREIGVMRACGATRATIRWLFTFEAALLGFFGGVIGLALSYLLSLVGNYIANNFAVSQSVPINNILQFPLWLILGVMAFTTFIGLLAGFYPAVRASRLDPVEALRYE